MDPRIGSFWLLATCVGIVMISCYISGVACNVPDDVVYTDLHKAVRIGDSVVLKCQFRGTPLAVYWKKGDDPSMSPTLVSWLTGDPVTGVCVGERLCRIMEMNAEFSLVIKEVSIVEQGLYVCTVTNYKGSQIHNFTDIRVFSPPKEPYPIINECQMISPNDTETTCTISTSQSVEISCSASGYFPDIDLYFLHGSTSLHTEDTIEVTNLDGTKNKTIYANATASEISYVCFASVPGSQEQRTRTVLVPMPTGPTDGSVAKFVVPVIFIVLLAVICISIILLRRRRQQKGQGTHAKVPYHSPMGKIDDFLASADNAVSDDDLEHICWHVNSCRETVQPILDSLQYSSTNSTNPADNGLISTPSRCDEIRKDLQIMKRWKAMSAETTYGDEDEHTESMPSNQMIQLCHALEKAGRTTGNSDGQVYHQLSKTFYNIRGEYKSELTDEVLKEFALNITKRHCRRLGKTFRLSTRAIANRNEEDLEMYRTDIMLKAWMMDQKCSNYEIRRRLRQAAEQCNRQDIADIFISKEQSEVMTSTMKLPACLTITNEKQSPGASGSESVQFISRDEIDRIERYVEPSILQALYDVVVPGQQSPEGKELLVETKAINVPKPTLDSKHKENDRQTLRQLLQNKDPRYACLLAKKKPFKIFNVELIDLAFRLIMADVYLFAKALNISDQVLTHYRCNLGSHNLTQGTANIMKQVSVDNRVKMVKAMEKAAYSEEARALYFGFEISLGDVIEVENKVDKAQLAKQLGVSADVQSTGPDNQVKDDTLHQSVLLRWRDTVRSSTFNHRLVLADALFNMGKKQLALDIISGVYRNRVIKKPVSELLAATIPEGRLPALCEVLNQKEKIGQNCQDVITAWVGENKYLSIPWKKQLSLSNRLVGAGFYAFAHEIMAVFNHETETGNVATEELHQGGIANTEPGTRKGLEPVAKDNPTIPTEGMQETDTTEEEVMLEKSGDGAAESK